MKSALLLLLTAALVLAPTLAPAQGVIFRPRVETPAKPDPQPEEAKPRKPKVEKPAEPGISLLGGWSIKFKCGFYSYTGTLDITRAGPGSVIGTRTNRYETAQIYDGSFSGRDVVLKTAFTDGGGKPRRDEYDGLMSADGRSISGTYVGEFDMNDDCTWTAQRN